MKLKIKKGCLLGFVMVSIGYGGYRIMFQKQEVTMIPRTVLFGNPLYAIPKISPDGKRLAYVAPLQDVLNIWVKSLGQPDDRVITKDTDRGIRSYFWAHNGRDILYLQDVGGDENWRLYAVEVDSQKIRDLTPFKNVQVQILDHDKHYPDEVLIAMNKENPKFHDVYHLNLKTGVLKLIEKNPGNFASWVSDRNFKVRAALGATASGGFDLMVKSENQKRWEKLLSWDSDDSLTSEPLGFLKDGQTLFLVNSQNANTGRLVAYSLSTHTQTVLSEDPKSDVATVMTHPETYEIQAVSYVKARREWKILDSTIQNDFKIISSISHGDVSIVSRDDRDERWVVEFLKDNGPIDYYLFDRASKKSQFIFSHKPILNQYKLSAMEPISFTARDGLTLHGYIAYPLHTARKNLPMVLNVHGGPWSRDTWGLNSEVQWLTNRGYVSLQINFRGSTGYGKDFINAAIRQWGAKMHDDLVDAVAWSVNQGIADPKKICIYGGSYGGYAALVGATFTPDLFACAVDIVGPSNLMTLLKSFPPYWESIMTMMKRRVGDPEKDVEFLKSISPLFKVDQIKIPILIAQGANDPRVKQAESEQIVEAMKKRGIAYEYLLFPDEGHGFVKPENRLKFYSAAEKFLHRHLGGRFEL